MISIFKRIIFSLLTIILGLAIIATSFWGIHELSTDYAQTRDRYIPITAYVSNVIENDFASGVSYDVYISYSYNENDYSMVHYKTIKKDEIKVGTEVTVKIDSENPGELYDKKTTVGGILFELYIIISILLSNIVFVFLVSSDLSFVITYRKRIRIYKDLTLSSDKVKHDVDIQYRCKKKLKIGLTVILIVTKVLFAAYLYLKTGALLMMCLNAASIVLLLIYVCLSLKKESQNNKNINIVCDTLKIKEALESDSEGGYSVVKKYSFYRLGDWHAEDDCLISFEKKEAEKLKTNTRFYVAINAKNKILRIFDYNEFKLLK